MKHTTTGLSIKQPTTHPIPSFSRQDISLVPLKYLVTHLPLQEI